MLGADVSLEWLRLRHKRIDAQNHERFEKEFKEKSYSFVLDNDGTYLIHPNEDLILKTTFQEVASQTADTADDEVANHMRNHESGSCKITKDGVSSVLFYSFVKYAEWTVVIVVPEAIINHQGNVLGAIILAVMLFGLIVIFFLSRALIRNIDQLRKTTAQKAGIEQELKIASHIQQSMLPKKYPPYPERPDVDIYGEIVTAKEVGGDLYDYLMHDNKLFFCIGDVSGKGVPAALMMAETISLFRCEAMLDTDPSNIISRMNKTLCDTNDSYMFVTLFLGVLDLKTGQLNYSNAGHEPPMLVGTLARFIYVDNNIPLGCAQSGSTPIRPYSWIATRYCLCIPTVIPRPRRPTTNSLVAIASVTEPTDWPICIWMRVNMHISILKQYRTLWATRHKTTTFR